jgi:hypothetical protein
VIEAASFHVTGLPALLIILAILAVFITGAVVIVRAIGRKARDTAGE